MANLISLPFSFSPNTLIQSSQVNADFQALLSYINAGQGSLTDNGYVVLPGGIYLQWATVTGVNFDGSGAAPISFPVAFPSACFGVVPSIKNAFGSNPWGLTIQWDTPTVSGFNLNVGGAPISNTGPIFYLAIGN